MITMDSRFSINWPYIAFVIFACAAGLGFTAWSLSMQFFGQLSKGLPITGGWGWPSVIAVDIACLAVFLVLLWKVYCDMHTNFGEDELSQPSLFGRRKIRWSEVTSIHVFGGVGYHVIAKDKKIVVTPYAYSNPEAVKKTLAERTEKNGQ